MQRSHYLKAYPCDQDPEYLILYSTRKASVVRIHKETFQAMEDGTLSLSEAALFLRLEMLVPDRDAEKRSMYGCLDDLNSNGVELVITVVLNLDCNFACLYCYEGDMKGKLYMSDETAGRLTAFIKEKFTPEKTSLFIDFYGGEPLLSLGLIRSISQEMKAFTQSRGASYSFRLITNGSLLKRTVAEELVLMGLTHVKITVDGPAEIHDKFRPFKSGAGSFDTIIENIKATCDLLSISIGGNYTPENYEKFVLLLDDLETQGLTPDKIHRVKFDAVMKQPDSVVSSPEFSGGCVSVNEPWLSEANEILREAILKRGYDTPKPGPIHCMVENTNTYVVNFDGVIYKCPAFVGKEGFAAGDLETGLKDYADAYKLDLWKNEDCIECEYLPLCFGGCRYMAFIKDGSIGTLDCQKPYFDTSLERLIKQDIRYRGQ